MTHRRVALRTAAFAVVIFAVLFGQVAWAQDTHGVEPLDPVEEVSAAYVPIMKFAPMYVASHHGLFEKYGLDVNINRVASGTEAIAFLEEGQIDVGGIAIVTSLWNGWNEGLDIRIIAPGGLEPFEDSPTKLMVRSDLAERGLVTSVGDLRGRNVAVAGGPGSGGEYLAAKALERGGLTIRDVNLMNIGNPDMPAVFEGGAIDAGILGSPYASEVEGQGHAEALATDLTPGLMTVAFVGSERFVNERPEVARRFTLALMEAARMMQGEDFLDDDNIDAYLSYVDATPEAVEGDQLLEFDPNQEIPVDGLADIEETHRKNGRTQYDEPLGVEGVVELSFVEWARDVLGPYED